MTIIPLAQVSLKNRSHIHGLPGHGVGALNHGERCQMVQLLEAQTVLITVYVPQQGKAAENKPFVPKTFTVHLSDCHFTVAMDEKWKALIGMEPPATPAAKGKAA